MYAFMRPRRIKNAALTEVPIIPPTVLKLSKREETAAAVAATTMEVMITILFLLVAVFVRIQWAAYVECPKEKKVPTVTGFWPLASSLRVIKSMACNMY